MPDAQSVRQAPSALGGGYGFGQGSITIDRTDVRGSERWWRGEQGSGLRDRGRAETQGRSQPFVRARPLGPVSLHSP